MPSPRKIYLNRSLAIVRLKRKLERDSFPRIQMGLIVALTGASGLLCSFLLLHAGMDSMTLRYPLALAGAYGFFLFLLWLWLRTKADDYGDVLDVSDFVPARGSGGTFHGDGGHFGGGGASASFDEHASISAESEPFKAITDAAGGGFDADGLAIPIAAILFAIGLALASLYVIYLAPVLFAELLFDGVLSYSLYRHLRATDTSHWLNTAFRRTVWPFALTAIFLVAVGAAMAFYAPGARSIGEVLHYNDISR